MTISIKIFHWDTQKRTLGLTNFAATVIQKDWDSYPHHEKIDYLCIHFSEITDHPNKKDIITVLKEKIDDCKHTFFYSTKDSTDANIMSSQDEIVSHGISREDYGKKWQFVFTQEICDTGNAILSYFNNKKILHPWHSENKFYQNRILQNKFMDCFESYLWEDKIKWEIPSELNDLLKSVRKHSKRKSKDIETILEQLKECKMYSDSQLKKVFLEVKQVLTI